ARPGAPGADQAVGAPEGTDDDLGLTARPQLDRGLVELLGLAAADDLPLAAPGVGELAGVGGRGGPRGEAGEQEQGEGGGKSVVAHGVPPRRILRTSRAGRKRQEV